MHEMRFTRCRVDTLDPGVSLTWNKQPSMTVSVPSPLPLNVDELRASLLELINTCPVEQCNPADCPLFVLRNVDHRQRLHWFASLGKADLEYLAAYHYTCMNLRLGERGRVSLPAGDRLLAGRTGSKTCRAKDRIPVPCRKDEPP
jgi:hypothetical protein